MAVRRDHRDRADLADERPSHRRRKAGARRDATTWHRGDARCSDAVVVAAREACRRRRRDARAAPAPRRDPASDHVSWPREAWAEAIWSSSLQPCEKFVALCYADHARGKRQAWVSYRRLTERTGYSRAWCAEAVRVLRETGWLRVVDKGRQHRSTVYELVTPPASSPDSGPLAAVQTSSIWPPSSPVGWTPPNDVPKSGNGQSRSATSKAQRRDSTSQVASAAFSPGERTA